MNESDFWIGVGRDQWVIVPVIKDQGQDQNKRVSHQFTHLIESVGSTEHLTVIETISAGAVTIDLFIIIKRAVIQLQWFADIESSDIAICQGVGSRGIE